MTSTLRPAEHKDSADTIDLLAVLDVLWRCRQLIAKTVGGVLVLGALYACFARPVYESNMLVRIENNEEGAASQLFGSLGSILGMKSSDDAEVEMLRSRYLVGAATDHTRFDILAEPKRFPLIGEWIARENHHLSTPGLFGLGGYAWGNEAIVVDRFDTPAELYKEPFSVTLLTDGRYLLSGAALSADQQGRLGETLRLSTDFGEVTLNIAGMHANPGTRFRLQRYSRQQTILDLQSRLVIVDKAKDAGVIAVSLRGSDPERITHYVTALGEAYVRQNGEQKAMQAEKSLAFLEQQLPGMKASLQQTEDALLAYRNAHGAVDLSEQAKLDLGQGVALQTRISTLRQERQAKLQDLMPDHPAVQAIDSQVTEIERELQGVNARVKQLPGREQDVIRLTREVRVNTELYVAMLNSVQQLKLVRAGKVGNVRIVDQPELPEKPVQPNPVLIMAAALFGGLFIGMCIVLLRNVWRGSVTDPHELEQLLDVPVQAVIPHSKDQSQRSRVRLRYRRAEVVNALPIAVTSPQDPSIESLRSLGMAVQFAVVQAGNPVALITGSTESVGKSFVSANLAILLARMGKRVLLIDADLRRGRLHRDFKLSEAPGLTGVLRGEFELAKAIQATEINRLSLLPSGAKQPDAIELLQGDSLDACMREAATMYDVVLVDSAPVLPVTDTLWVARRAGAVYAVARYGVSSEGELLETRARLARAGIELAGVVLNGTHASLRGVRYGQYGYGSYLSETAEAGTAAASVPTQPHTAG